MLMSLRFRQLLDLNELYQLKKPHLCNNLAPVSLIRCSLCKEYLILFHWNLSHEPIAHLSNRKPFLTTCTTGMSCTTSRGGGYSLIWPIGGCAARQGTVFVLSVLNRVYNFARVSVLNRVCNFAQVCPKQCAWFVRVCSNYKQGVGPCKNRVLLSVLSQTGYVF